MEHRIHALEKSLAGKIIIESSQWENLESRVLLLETRLALSSAQVGEFNICLEVCNCKFQIILQLWHNAAFSQNSLWWLSLRYVMKSSDGQHRYSDTSKALACVSFEVGKYVVLWRLQTTLEVRCQYTATDFVQENRILEQFNIRFMGVLFYFVICFKIASWHCISFEVMHINRCFYGAYKKFSLLP